MAKALKWPRSPNIVTWIEKPARCLWGRFLEAEVQIVGEPGRKSAICRDTGEGQNRAWGVLDASCAAAWT